MRMKTPAEPKTMTPAQINRELDALDTRDSELTTAMITAGRGFERPSEYLTKADPLAQACGAWHYATKSRHAMVLVPRPGCPMASRNAHEDFP